MKGAMIGAIIGIISNAIANYITFGDIQPSNIVVGLVVGAIIGHFAKIQRV